MSTPARPPGRDGGSDAATGSVPTVGFVLEQTLGHVTHAQNLRSIIPPDGAIAPRWAEVAWEIPSWGRAMPPVRNWTVRAGVRARRAIARLDRETPLDALFVHTQVPAVLAADWMARIPTVVSVDATPIQYDELGEHYGHARGAPAVERLKYLANRRCFDRAAHLVTWSDWAKQGLVDRYDVPPGKVTVIAPGVDVDAWTTGAPGPVGGPIRLLFVGGDLHRKGGNDLLAAFRSLRARRADLEVELHLVTKTPVAAEPGVVVHHGLGPNSAELRALYGRADIFCLPTSGDCLPMVLSEAGACGLPLVSTAVGAIPEIVRDGETGLLVPPRDRAALTAALERLVVDGALRRRLGEQASALVRRDYDARANAGRLVDLLATVARTSTVGAAPRRRPAADVTGGSQRRQVLLTVSGEIPDDLEDQIAMGRRPRPDYQVLAETFEADVLDVRRARERSGAPGRVIERLGGPHALLAWATFRLRRRYAVVFTDGEQIGLPLAALCRMTGSRVRHLMIGHLLSTPAKTLLVRLLRLERLIDVVFVYASAQRRFLEQRLGFASEKVVLTPFMVDTAFFRPQPRRATRNLISSAGLEHRDYATLVRAVQDLDVDVVLAAASPWSRRPDDTREAELPPNVEVRRLPLDELRDLYAASRFVVVPLEDVPFQAGVTTILEAMAMGKAVVCSRTPGQTDVVVDGVNGLYVTPGDVHGLRNAIQKLLDDPDMAARLGAAGRRLAEQEMDVHRYAARLGGYVRAARHEAATR